MDSQRKLVFVATALVGSTALFHLLLGVDGVVDWLVTGELSDVLAPLFLLSGIAIFVGMGAVYRGILSPRPAYALGAVMMVVYLVGYADWHAFGYTETILGLEETGHSHDHDHESHGHDGHGDHDGHDAPDSDDSALVNVIDHLRADYVAFACKTVETVAAAVLAVLAIGSE